MSNNTYLDNLWSDQESGKYVFSAIRSQRVLEAQKQKEDFKWQQHLYPSSLSFGMCVYEHLQKIETPWFVQDAVLLEKMSLGSYLHLMFQETLLQTDKLYGEPNYPKDIKKILDAKKKKKHYPEVYVYVANIISGYADAVIRKQGKPVVIDFKTKNEENAAKWEEMKKTFPLEKEETQACIYAVVINDNKYFDKPIEEYGICYYNNAMITKPEAEYEVYKPLTPEKIEKTRDLLLECKTQVARYINKEDSTCEYVWCKKHALQ